MLFSDASECAENKKQYKRHKLKQPAAWSPVLLPHGDTARKTVGTLKGARGGAKNGLVGERGVGKARLCRPYRYRRRYLED